MSKLIRSRVDVPATRVRPPRDREEYLTLLRSKLLEEAFEALNASAAMFPRDDLLNELADVVEVVETLALEHGFSWRDVFDAKEAKVERVGTLVSGRVYT